MTKKIIKDILIVALTTGLGFSTGLPSFANDTSNSKKTFENRKLAAKTRNYGRQLLLQWNPTTQTLGLGFQVTGCISSSIGLRREYNFDVDREKKHVKILGGWSVGLAKNIHKRDCGGGRGTKTFEFDNIQAGEWTISASGQETRTFQIEETSKLGAVQLSDPFFKLPTRKREARLKTDVSFEWMPKTKSIHFTFYSPCLPYRLHMGRDDLKVSQTVRISPTLNPKDSKSGLAQWDSVKERAIFYSLLKQRGDFIQLNFRHTSLDISGSFIAVPQTVKVTGDCVPTMIKRIVLKDMKSGHYLLRVPKLKYHFSKQQVMAVFLGELPIHFSLGRGKRK